MDKIFEPFIKLLNNPLTDFFLLIGLGEDISKAFSSALIALSMLLTGICLKALQKWRKNNKTARDLKPEFDYKAVDDHRKIFIQTRYDRISPNRYDNPNEVYKHNEPRKLIPFMIGTSFNEKIDNEKYYLILGDSGMGKTAFMVNLYMAYHSFFYFFRQQKQKMKLFRFQPPDITKPVDVLERINAIADQEAKNTILLLDGLDEDPFIISKDPNISDEDTFVERLNSIANSTMRFSDVVITCRTQYFPQEELQDYDLNIRKRNGGFYKLNKYYLFPFSDKEVQQYLNRKYGRIKFWNWTDKKRAKKLVQNAHKLMSRPMLLSYLDDLVSEEKGYQFSYQIYETLIDKWLKRESEKWKKSHEQEQFKNNLRKLAQETALHIYENWKSKGSLYLTKDEAKEIAKTHNIPLEPDEVTGKSLLTCDPLSNWKFAHKSILEYFLAKECSEDFSFAINFNFRGMDMAKHFYIDMLPEVNWDCFSFIKGGTFLMGSPDSESGRSENETHHEVKVGDYYMAKQTVTVEQFGIFIEESGYKSDADKDGGSYNLSKQERDKKSGVNWRCDVTGEEQKEKDHPVINVSWNDAVEYCKWLSEKAHVSFRLPTEAEWEYACRAGSKTPFSTGHNLTTDQANYNGRYPYNNNPKGKYIGKTTPVGAFPPNGRGLNDMHGNVWEWCSDWYGDKYYGACKKAGIIKNPKGPETGSYRVLRGGSWGRSAQDCRCAFRSSASPSYRYDTLGFRLVFVP